ncbi:c-type cytochrome biogenesis protein CcmI [Microvirga mediterraneensis]|uniref:C-type cytochrome biogenesis protein CcmI n=1 Tax=Microvirga mediterraneensis TaxID=2754695 RepID=A0A838BSM0_9HYPH|nr:c-type cytochrome biogenesis protein CcmI [Microvirga mediterraneensis]MBA1158039.1 c-type cytochrome biogenesis protein CcmI [Microvirga mediterraneensis]
MVIWIILLAMTAAAVMAVLWPLSRHYAVARQVDPDTQFYREQISEIERDLSRGVLLPGEAEAAKAEAGRRLLRATGLHGETLAAVGEPALRRRRAASTLAVSIIPILALATYEIYGSPQSLSRPAAEQAPQQAGNVDLMTAVAQIESHLAKNPQDGRGWEVIAPVYLRMGRIDDAARAYEAAARYLPPTADRFANYGEVLVMARDGLVSDDAQAAFEQALKLDPTSPKARFYVARAAVQDGQVEKAKSAYTELLSSSPPDAPWVEAVKQELAALGAPQAANPASESQRIGPEAIAGMVAGLAGRLESQGGTAEEWARLMRSYTVLGQRDKAVAAARRAREALAQDKDALKTIDMMAQELKLTDAQP